MMSVKNLEAEQWVNFLASTCADVAHPLASERVNECAQILETWLSIPAYMRMDAEDVELTAEMHRQIQHWNWQANTLLQRPEALWTVEIRKSGQLWLCVAQA